jgi:uncharacterized protein (TIGR02466 family)
MLDQWFSTPIFVHDFEGADLEAIQSELTLAMPEIRKAAVNETQGGTIKSTFTYGKGFTDDIATFKLDTFRKEIIYIAHQYMLSLKHHGKPLQLEGSWTMFNGKGGSHFDHAHPFYRVSGCYYYATNGQDGNIRFENPNLLIHAGLFPADGIPTESVTYAPKVGRVILFPSWLMHRVEMNNTNSERISIAFNFV